MYLYFLGTILQCEIKVLRSTVNGSLMGKLCGVGGKSEGCGTHIVKDLEALVLKTIMESGYFCTTQPTHPTSDHHSTNTSPWNQNWPKELP